MPKELKELKSFTQGNITAMGAEEIPDEAAAYSLDVDNNSEFGILQGRHEDLVINSAHNSGHYYGTISRFTPLIDDKVYRDLIFVKIIAGVRKLNSGVSTNTNDERITTDDASPPYQISIGVHPKFLESGSTESIRAVNLSSNGDISMESTGKAVHIGFGGDDTSTSPKWVGHFGHDRFDYAWNKAYPYVEEDWISTKDLTKDMDIIAHSYEDAHDYDPSTYSQGTMHHYVLAGALSGNSLTKIDVSVSPPAIVREMPNELDGINCVTQAWNRFSSNVLIEHSEGNINSQTFSANTGGWSAISTFGSLTNADTKANITPNGSSGIGKISHKFNAKKGDKFTLEFDSLELASIATLKYSVGTTEGGTDVVNEETLAVGSLEPVSLARKDIHEKSTSGDSSTTYFLEEDQMDSFTGTTNLSSGNRFYINTENASNKVQELYLTLIIQNSSATNTVSKFDGVKLLGCCNNVGDNANIDGYWVFYGDYDNTPTGYGYGALAKLNRTTLAVEATRLISGWGHTWMNTQRTWHDGHYGNSTGGYISQIMQCGEKIWFNVKTDNLRGGFVAARPKEIRIHDGYYAQDVHFEFTDGYIIGSAEQYLHGQIGLLYNADIPYIEDGLSEIRPDNRTPDSCLGLNNVKDVYCGQGSRANPAFHIPSAEHPGYYASNNGEQQFSNGEDSFENAQNPTAHYTTAARCHNNAIMSNMSWMTESFSNVVEGTSGEKTIAYKTYRMSMARIPDSKCGINWFFSAGAVSAGTGTSFPSYNSEDVKVAAYVGVPKYAGDSDNAPHSTDGGLAGLFSGQIALHYLATVGPRYQNVHRILQKNNVFNNNITSLQVEDGLLVEGEQVKLDSVGQQFIWTGASGNTGYFNINEALGGKTTSATRELAKTYNGSVWKSDLSSLNSHNHAGGGINMRIQLTEYFRRHGFSRYCTLAPVDLCFAEMLDLRGDVKSGKAEYIGVEGGATPDSVKWYNVKSEPVEAIGAIGNTAWQEVRETTSYKESLSQENAFNSGGNHRKYPNDHYDDVVGITMVPYLNHKNNLFRGNSDPGWLNNSWESNFGGLVSGSDASWTGGVKLAVLVNKDGVGAWRMPNSPNNYGGGAPSILGLNDANSDGAAGGICKDGNGLTFWDNTRMSAKVTALSTRNQKSEGYLKGNDEVDGEGQHHCPHFLPGMISTLANTKYFGMSVARPYSPHFILTNGTNGTDNFTGNVDVYAVNASWGNDMNPAATDDIYNNNTFAFLAAGGVGKIISPVGSGQFDMYSKGWNGFYYNGYELWGRETLGATGDPVSSSNLNALAVTSGDQVTANPIFQIRGETSGKLVISGNIAKPHSTVEAESSGSIGPSDTGNNISPGYSEDIAYNDDGDSTTPLSGNALYTTTNAHYNDLEHWYSGSIADGVGVDLQISLSSNDSDGEFMEEKFYHYKYAFLYDGNQETPLSTQTYGQTDTSIKYRKIQVILTKNTLPRRITHITIYRAQSSSQFEQQRDESFRLIQQLPLTTGPNGENSTDYPGFKDHTEAGKSIYKVQPGDTYIIDNGNIGSSYESINGMSETIEDFRVYYGLSTQINGQHWVAKCYRPEFEGGERYVMYSKPGKFSTFNWLDDYLRLPSVPTALAAFNGRVYAWDEGNMYRIDPSLGKVEDILEGVGCIGPNAVTVTDYGMIFCDRNNIYLHDGQTAKAIGDPILNNTSRDNVVLSTPAEEQEDGYQKLAANAIDNPMWGKPRIWTSWAGQCNSFIVGITSQIGSKRTFLYTYKPSLNRWDKWSIYLDGDEITSIFVGFDGQCYFPTTGQTTQTSGLSRLLGQKYQNVVNEGMRKAFKWHSKRITMGSSTQKKKFKNLKASGNQDIANDTSGAPSEIKVYLDNKSITSTVSSTDLSAGVTDEEKYYLNEYNASSSDSKDFYGIKIKVEGNKDLKLESLGIIYRRKTIK